MSEMIYVTPGEVRTNIPAPVDFVGREKEIQLVLDALNINTRAWIISLTGVGGIGKTELAIYTANILKHRKAFDNIVWTTAKQNTLTEQGIKQFIPDYILTSLGDLLDSIIEVLGIDPLTLRMNIERKTTQVKEALQKSRTLLIIDNFETVSDRAVLKFLMDDLLPPSKALITSRLGGFSAYGVLVPQSLVGQKELRIGPMSELDSVELFVKRASERGLNYSTEENLPKIKETVNKAARMPLAIEWIVGQIGLGKSLDQTLGELRAAKTEVLGYCFDNLLSAVGKRAEKLLLAIPVFPDPVTADAVSFVTEMNNDKRDESLHKLIAASLLESQYNNIFGVRYFALAPTRLLVTTIWKEFPDLVERYHLRAVQYFIRQLHVVDEARQWKDIEFDIDNILYIFNWCFANSYHDQVLELAHELSITLHRIGKWDQRAFICELATKAATYLGNSRAAVEFAFDAAEVHKHRGRFEQALQEFYQCEELSNQIGDKISAAHARMQAGIVMYHIGKFSDANAILEHTLSLHRTNNDNEGMSINYSVLGRAQIYLGDLDKAQIYFSESLKLKQKLSDSLGEAIGKYDLGRLYHLKKNYIEAEALFKDSIELLERMKIDRRHLANAKRFYAYLKFDQGDLIQARSLLVDVLYIEEDLQRSVQIEETSSKLTQIDSLISQDSGRVTANLTRFGKIFVVGIEEYATLPRIPGAVKSARAIAESLSKCLGEKVNINYLLNNDSTTAIIKKNLLELIGEDIIIVLVAHMCQFNNRNYFCCYDTDLTNLDETAIEGTEFKALLREVASDRRNMLILDGHHFDQTFLAKDNFSQIKSGLSSKYLEFLADQISGVVLSSSSDGEFSHHFSDMEENLFSHNIAKGLREVSNLRGDGAIHLTDLYYYLEKSIREKVRDQVPKLYPEMQELDIALGLDQQQIAKEGINVSLLSDNDSKSTFISISQIREGIVDNPVEGAARLSAFLSDFDKELKDETDLCRSELIRIEKIQQKYTSIDPSLISERQRNIYRLLEICRKFSLQYQ